jgi:hypothetical protein
MRTACRRRRGRVFGVTVSGCDRWDDGAVDSVEPVRPCTLNSTEPIDRFVAGQTGRALRGLFLHAAAGDAPQRCRTAYRYRERSGTYGPQEGT